jgi:hypothetical protein
MELTLIIVGLVLFDWAALRWGTDSREGLNSVEWARRKTWRGFSR